MNSSTTTVCFFLSFLKILNCDHVEMVARYHEYKMNTQLLIPQHIHITFGIKMNDIIIMWVTLEYDSSIVKFHTGDLRESTTVEGQCIKLGKSGYGAAPYFHRVYLKDLDYGIIYYYRVMGKNSAVSSDQYSFHVPKEKLDKPLTLMVYTDFGTQSQDLQFAMYEAMSGKYEFIFYIGDIIYNLDGLGGTFGDTFMSKIQNAAARLPFMPCSGDYGRFVNFTSFKYRFSLPSVDWPVQNRTWYSVNTANVHFVVYSTDILFYDKHNAEAQDKWLLQDLTTANNNRHSQPWIIAMGHRSMYCSSKSSEEDCQKQDSIVREAFEDLFFEQGVDLVITGHEHMYERTFPVYKRRLLAYNYVDPKGPVHINIGSSVENYTYKQTAAWSAYIFTDMKRKMFGRLIVLDTSRLVWEAVVAKDNSVVDKIWIIQRIHGPFTSKTVFIPAPFNWERNMEIQKPNQNVFSVSRNSIVYMLIFIVAFIFAMQFYKRLPRLMKKCLK